MAVCNSSVELVSETVGPNRWLTTSNQGLSATREVKVPCF